MIQQYFEEFETDKIIREKFFPDFNYKGTMVEVGAATPEFLSVSHHFRLNGWRCICIEPNPIFAELHRQRGNEIYQLACSDQDKDAQDFEIVHEDNAYEKNEITDHSFSSLSVKQGYKNVDPKFGTRKISKTKVNVRKLDTILADLKIESVDFVSVDTEGWELEVMKGFNTAKYKPKLILLENFLHDPNYAEYMQGIGYSLLGKMNWNYVFVPAANIRPAP